MNVSGLATGVWISDVDERYSVYVHDVEVNHSTDRYAVTWEWLSHPDGFRRSDTETMKTYDLSVWPYHRADNMLIEEMP